MGGAASTNQNQLSGKTKKKKKEKKGVKSKEKNGDVSPKNREKKKKKEDDATLAKIDEISKAMDLESLDEISDDEDDDFPQSPTSSIQQLSPLTLGIYDGTMTQNSSQSSRGSFSPLSPNRIGEIQSLRDLQVRVDDISQYAGGKFNIFVCNARIYALFVISFVLMLQDI